MRVLHLTTSFPLQEDSSSGIFIERLVKAFPDCVDCLVLTPDSIEKIADRNRKYTLITYRYAPRKLQVLAHGQGGLPVALAKSKKNVLLLPGLFLAMFRHVFVYARQCDVIHAHWSINGVIAGLAGKIVQVPVVTTLRGEDVSRAGSSLVYRFLLRACLFLSDRVVTVSGRMRENLVNLYLEKKERISFIANGVGENFFALPEKKDGRTNKILILGNLVPVKGVDIVLNALGQCPGRQNWTLCIAGEGMEKDRLKKLTARLGLEEHVSFPGQVSPREIVNLLAQTDILVQASHQEGRPNSVLEAMAAGVSVIGSDIDGISELIEHGKNGLLFPAGDSKALAGHLARLIGSPDIRRRFGAAARQTLLNMGLTWPNCAGSYQRLYEKLISVRAKKRSCAE
ncbi:glycosyltransferase family 4 protein [Desulfomarina sp.]